MSGGAFDYKQYVLDEIIEKIESVIEESEMEKPPKVKRLGIACYRIISETCKASTGYYRSFTDINEAIRFYADNGYIICEDKVNEGLRYVLLEDPKQDYGNIEIYEYIYEEYEDGNYYAEYSDKTINEFKKGLDLIKKANVYINRIDYLISGDDGEESFHNRLSEDMNKIQ